MYIPYTVVFDANIIITVIDMHIFYINELCKILMLPNLKKKVLVQIKITEEHYLQCNSLQFSIHLTCINAILLHLSKCKSS